MWELAVVYDCWPWFAVVAGGRSWLLWEVLGLFFNPGKPSPTTASYCKESSVLLLLQAGHAGEDFTFEEF